MNVFLFTKKNDSAEDSDSKVERMKTLCCFFLFAFFALVTAFFLRFLALVSASVLCFISRLLFCLARRRIQLLHSLFTKSETVALESKTLHLCCREMSDFFWHDLGLGRIN